MIDESAQRALFRVRLMAGAEYPTSGMHNVMDMSSADFSLQAGCSRTKCTVALGPGGNSEAEVRHRNADLSNVSAVVHGAEMGVAQTRAVNRALRKAYGVGIWSVDEIGRLAYAPRIARLLTARRFTDKVLSASTVSKALWKLSWFLRGFGYDIELLDRD